MFGFVSSYGARTALRSSFSHFRGSTCIRRPRAAIRMAATSSTNPASPTMVRARHILVDSEAMIDTVQKQIEEGEKNFEDLARIVSTCPSKEKGGDLGWFQRNTMVKEFEEVVFSNPPGSVVKVQTQFGWHLIKVEGHGLAAKAITVKEYEERFGEGGTGDSSSVQLIDCREKNELEIAALPGFLNLPMGEYDEWADQFDRGDLGLEKDKETIVMCHHGVRSANFCSFLSQQGFTNARNLIGGIDAYSRKINPSVPVY